MLINLTDVFTSAGKVKNETICYEPESFYYMGTSYSFLEKSPVRITLTNMEKGRILLEGNMGLTIEIPCDRCLQSVKVNLNLKFLHELSSPEALKEADEDGQVFMSGYELNIEALVNNEIMINMPVKVLCKSDCKGICMQCGKNLNEGECGCDTFVPDPRMAAIKDIFNANKEV